jgi:predicted  nucleic acid-binding Zn-ribbon protein
MSRKKKLKITAVVATAMWCWGATQLLADLRDTISSLLREEASLRNEAGQISQESATLTTLGENLKQRDADLKRERANIENERTNLRLESAAIDSAISQYNSYCQGTFYAEEYRRRKAWCDANFGPLNARKKANERRRDDFNARINNYNEDIGRLSKDTLDWAARTKRLNARYQDYLSNLRSWHQRMLAVVQAAQARADASVECANIPGIGEFERRLDGASERAHRCLQRIWDGAE